MIVILTGVPGSGKGKVIELVKRRMDVSVFNIGDFLFRTAVESGLVEDRDDMKWRIGIETTRAMRKKVVEGIKSEIEKLGENVIVDTHCTVKSPAGYFPGLPFEILRKLKPHAIVVREVDPASVVERRNSDRANGVRVRRDEEEVSLIRQHQEINRSFAAAYSAISGATLRIVVDRKEEQYEFQNAEMVAKAVLEVFEFR